MRGLLHRIASGDPKRRTDRIRSIVANLHAILNTQKGDGHSSPDLGVDLLELLARWPSSESEVMQAVSETIRRYEPRLRNVRVRRVELERGSTVMMEISAELADDEHLRLLTELSRNGRVHIR